MQFRGGAAEMQFLGDGYEVAQVTKFHLIRNKYQTGVNNILDADACCSQTALLGKFRTHRADRQR